MSSKTTVLLVDDIDGKEAHETLAFVFDGNSYEIDLSEKNAEKFRSAVAPWVGHARRTGRAKINGNAVKPAVAPVKKGFTTADRTAIQTYAKKNKLPAVADRGRIARATIDAWEAAGKPA